MRGAGQKDGRQAHFGSPVVAVAGVFRVELLARASYEVAYTPASPVIGFAFDSQTGTHAFASSRKVAFQAKLNHLSFVPPDCDVYSQSSGGGEYLKITLERGLSSIGNKGRRFSNVIDAQAIPAAHRLRRELLAGHGIDSLPCERLVQVLAERAGCILNGGLSESRGASWMTPQRLRRTDEIIEARLGEKLTVNELADALGLSAGFFSRAFKAAMGKAPHEYIIDRRVARARELLRARDLDLASIAHAAGFASHAHMTTVFRERFGVTPSDVRRRIVE